MQRFAPTRRFPFRLLAFALAAGLSAEAQLAPSGQPKPPAGTLSNGLPATAPTDAAVKPAEPAVPKNLNPGQKPPHRASVTWRGGLLTIDADNSSLNQILREISRQTGMKITGGVNDERVFGTYGPGSPGKILEMLVGGMGTNVLLVLDDQSKAPAELILTPRQGGATPPNPNAGAHDDDRDAEDLPPQQIRPRQTRSEPFRTPTAAAVPAGTQLPTPNPVLPAAAVAPATPSPASPAAGDTTQQSPNGVKTPQQIYEQLLQMQKKNTSTTTPQ